LVTQRALIRAPPPVQGGPDPSPSLVAPAGHSPLGRGFLSGRFKSPDDLDEGDFRRYGPRFTGANLEANQKLAAKVEDIAHDKRITSAQLALAWVLAQGEDPVPIPGTKRRRYLEHNAAAADVELTEADPERKTRRSPRLPAPAMTRPAWRA